MMFRVPLIVPLIAVTLAAVGCAAKAERVEAFTPLPREITTPSGEVVSDAVACTRAGGEWLLSDPALCTVAISVKPGTFTPGRSPVTWTEQGAPS